MPKLNEHRIVKRRNWFFPFNYEGGTIGMLQMIIGDGIQLLLLLKRLMNGLKKLENVFINIMGIEYETIIRSYKSQIFVPS